MEQKKHGGLTCPTCNASDVKKQKDIWESGTALVSGPRYLTMRNPFTEQSAPPEYFKLSELRLYTLFHALVFIGGTLFFNWLGANDSPVWAISHTNPGFSYLLCACLVVLLGMLLTYHRFNIKACKESNQAYPERYTAWEKSYRCLSCGEVFNPED